MEKGKRKKKIKKNIQRWSSKYITKSSLCISSIKVFTQKIVIAHEIFPYYDRC